MLNPQLLLESIEKMLAEWEIFGRRAQVKAIMPIINELAEHGVGCAVLARLLEERNFAIKPATLRQALHRWRLKQASILAAPPPSDQTGSGISTMRRC